MQKDLAKFRIPIDSIVVLGEVPKEYKPTFEGLKNYHFQPLSAALVVNSLFTFVHRPEDVAHIANELQNKMSEDPVLWVLYLKKSSAKNTGLISRDRGWESFASLQIEPVSQLSWDDDYSALRFRRVAKIKTITRNPKMAINQETKKRTSYKK